MQIYLDMGDFGTYEISNDQNDKTILIQSDYEFPSVAQTFGWDGEHDDIDGAITFLDELAGSGESVEDPGYFDLEDGDLADEDEEEYDFNDMDSYSKLSDNFNEDDEQNPYGF